jgi:hypothetical protein
MENIGRPIERIKPFLDKLSELWLKFPDLRFAQIVNLIEVKSKEMYQIQDIFYLEEVQIAQVIKELLND